MKLSIIVPVYNLEKYIANTLESLISIHFSYPYEIVVINDGSTDSSESIIKQYQDQNSCISLYTINNGGASNARNVGISKSKGEYITFIDGDDTVDPFFYEKAISEMDASGYDFVQGNFRIISGETVVREQFIDHEIEMSDKIKMQTCFFHPKYKYIHNSVWDKVFKRELIELVKFDKSIVVAEDQKYVFDVINHSKHIKLLSYDSVNYYIRSSSIMRTLNVDGLKNRIDVLDYCRSLCANDSVQKYIDYHRLISLLDLYRSVVKIRKKEADYYYNKINDIDVRSIAKWLNIKQLVVVLCLKYCRFFCDLYFGYKGR